MTTSSASQTSGFARSTAFLADLMLAAAPVSTSRFMTKGLNSSSAISFGQAALVHLQLRADDDNRTAGIVDTLTQKVLAETALFTLEHIGKRFQRAVVRAGDRTAAAAVVDQGVDCLLQHPLFVADDDVRGAWSSSRRFKRLLRLMTRR